MSSKNLKAGSNPAITFGSDKTAAGLPAAVFSCRGVAAWPKVGVEIGKLMKLVLMAAAFLGLVKADSVELSAAESHLVVDHESGHILVAKGEDTPRQVASLTKIATVMVVLEWIAENGGNVTDQIPVTKDAISGGANPLAVKEGDQLPLETALFAAMMASDNTSASAMAEAFGKKMNPAVSGQEAVAEFVERMNLLAKDLGMERTRFINPHGLDGEEAQGVSTASDMARLAIHAYDHPEFGRFCREKEKTVTVFRNGAAMEVRLINTNELLGSRGIDGTKTGTTRRSGECLIASATGESGVGGSIGNRRLISVVLKSGDRFRDAVLLLNQGWAACASWLAEGRVSETNHHLRKRVN